MELRRPTLRRPDHAIILAAGRGSRLDPEEGYKLLVEIGGRTLFDRHLEQFARLGVGDVTVVTGYRHADLDRAVENWEPPEGLDLHVAVNPAFDGGNGLSVIAGIDQARRNSEIRQPEPFWLTMSDHVYQPAVFEKLERRVAWGNGDLEGLLVVDRKLDEVYDLDDANAIRTEGGELDSIGKKLTEFDCVDTGLFWCDEEFAEALDAERESRGDCSTSDAVRRLARRDAMALFDLEDARWQDVDTPGAREHAEELAASGTFDAS
jgi:choline kinase